MQAQEYSYALWGLAQRTSGAGAADLRKLVDDGVILRTHALRPTWHFVAAEDLGWIQELTGPRVHALNAYYYRQIGLDADTAARTKRLITGALRGGNHLTRTELASVLAAGGYPASGPRLGYMVMCAELDGLIANGPMRGKQHTYALVEERVPAPRALSFDEALAELTRRFFTAHGPATVRDFAWWSSLTMAQIKHGLDLVGSALTRAEVDGLAVWYDASAPADPPGGAGRAMPVDVPGGAGRAMPADPGLGDAAGSPAARDGSPAARGGSPNVLLLQGYDEYVVAYSNTKFVFNPGGVMPNPGLFTESTMLHAVVIDGQVKGRWRRVPRGKGFAVELDLAEEPTAKVRKALDAELARHETYMGVTTEVVRV